MGQTTPLEVQPGEPERSARQAGNEGARMGGRSGRCGRRGARTGTTAQSRMHVRFRVRSTPPSLIFSRLSSEALFGTDRIGGAGLPCVGAVAAAARTMPLTLADQAPPHGNSPARRAAKPISRISTPYPETGHAPRRLGLTPLLLVACNSSFIRERRQDRHGNCTCGPVRTQPPLRRDDPGLDGKLSCEELSKGEDFQANTSVSEL